MRAGIWQGGVATFQSPALPVPSSLPALGSSLTRRGVGYTPVAALTCSSRCHLHWLQTAALGPRSVHILGPWDDELEKRPVEALKAAQGSGGRELQGYVECVLE